ncbi:hypothetical protein APT_01216 [Acetobacter pasteurianus NBRC 101655]|nr:hypothetical protein APT_01216 [Acetobacter pasteurianus NBRC 101655]
MTQGPKVLNRGVEGADFPLWKVKEALAQAEKRIASQLSQLNLIQARATSILGWISAEVLGTLALIGGNISKGLTSLEVLYWILFALSIIVPSAIATFYLCYVLPKMKWAFEGTDPTWLLVTVENNQSEYSTTQVMAEAKAKAVKSNDAILLDLVENLRLGWGWFLFTPIIAVVSILMIEVLSLIK